MKSLLTLADANFSSSQEEPLPSCVHDASSAFLSLAELQACILIFLMPEDGFGEYTAIFEVTEKRNQYFKGKQREKSLMLEQHLQKNPAVLRFADKTCTCGTSLL